MAFQKLQEHCCVLRLFQGQAIEFVDCLVVNADTETCVSDPLEGTAKGVTNLGQKPQSPTNKTRTQLRQLAIENLQEFLLLRVMPPLRQVPKQCIAIFYYSFVGLNLGEVLTMAVKNCPIEKSTPGGRTCAGHLKVFRGKQDDVELTKVLRDWPNCLAIQANSPRALSLSEFVYSLEATALDSGTDVCFLPTERNQLCEPLCPKRSQRSNDVDRLEKICLSLAIIAVEDIESGLGLKDQRGQVPNPLEF